MIRPPRHFDRLLVLMKRILICLLLLAPHPLFAQTSSEEWEQQLAVADEQADQARAAADRPALIRALKDVGHAQLGLGDSAKALASFRLSLKLAREIEDQPGIAGNLLAIGQLHVDEGRLPSGAETLRRAVAVAEPIGDEQVLHDAHASLSRAYAALGQYNQAYASSRRATELASVLAERSTEERLSELAAGHEADRQAVAAESAARQQELLAERQEGARRENRIKQLTGLAIGGVALLLLLLSLVGLRRSKGLATRALAEKDHTIAQIEGELHLTSDERDRLSTLRDQAAGESERLSAELRESAGERDRLSAELEQSSRKLARTAHELEQTFVELKRTSSDHDRAVGELAHFAGVRDQQAAALEQTTAEVERLAAEVERLAAELERTVSDRDGQISQLGHTTAEAERISDQLMQASAERDQAASERDRLTDQLARTLAELDKLRTDCRQDISAMADRNAAARSRLVEMERFNSTLSQHLKILLVAVRSSLGALRQDAVAGDVEQLKKDVQRTHVAVGNTVRLLDELQKLLLVGRVVHAPEAASMSELAFEAVGQVAGLADRRVEVVIAPNLPAVYGDRTQLLEVLRRLLENGGKFMGHQPSPRLQVGHRRDWPRADAAQDVFYVRDNGLGIEARDHERVFTLFEKLDPNTEGLGIGLPLVKRIIEAHGGRVWVESDGAGRGSTFCFTLSRKYALPPAAASSPEPAAE